MAGDNKDALEIKEEIITVKPSVMCETHYFDYISGTEVQCRKCPLGYPVTPNLTVKEGHLYIGSELVI